MKRAVIIGAGPGGLSAAYRLQKEEGVSVVVLEREPGPGGRVKSMELPPGFAADESAQFYARNYANTIALCRELGIEGEFDPVDEKRFFALYRGGKMQPLPTGALSFLRTKSLSAREKWRLTAFAMRCLLSFNREGMLRPGVFHKEDHVSLAEYSIRRFGQKSTDEIVRAGVGMLMADLEEVNLAFALSLFPLMASPHMVLRHGNGTFTRSLARACEGLRVSTAAERIRIKNDKVEGVELAGGGGFLEADAVICATRAPQAAELLAGLGEEDRDFLQSIAYSVCLQVLFGTEKPYLPCWGMYFPPAAGSFIASLTEESFKSPGRAPKGRGLTQAFITGGHARDLMEEEDEIIVEKIHQEVRRFFPGYPEKRLFHKVVRQREAMVIPRPGFYAKVERLRRRASKVRGLYLVGDYVSNPIIEASVSLGLRAAEDIARG